MTIAEETEIRKVVKDEIEKSMLDIRQWKRVDTASDSFSAISMQGLSQNLKPIITGSKGANAALTSLITALSFLNLIVDDSS